MSTRPVELVNPDRTYCSKLQYNLLQWVWGTSTDMKDLEFLFWCPPQLCFPAATRSSNRFIARTLIVQLLDVLSKVFWNRPSISYPTYLTYPTYPRIKSSWDNPALEAAITTMFVGLLHNTLAHNTLARCVSQFTFSFVFNCYGT